ncbi:hypothetical protein [Nostoc sp. CHAB 5715]|uniref:hypothetical protein n=1 Tax=Nostoc sp. CHAB 5715 TaxID=2780400 RepID=UPI001E4B3DAD|nr:hypothetical protein [Nostoc sp. CHAB 5715]MCC5621344.1 hypothetical protein [Nostoc sp. CHAB 5715]
MGSRDAINRVCTEWGVRSEELRSNTSRIISPNTGSSFAIAILNLDKINRRC